VNLHGFDSGSKRLESNLGGGTGWTFLRPAGVIAGFLVLEKSGFTLRFKISPSRVAKALLSLERMHDSYAPRMQEAFSNASLVVHGSFSTVKAAKAVMISTASSILWRGIIASRRCKTDTPTVDFKRSILYLALCASHVLSTCANVQTRAIRVCQG